MTEKPKPEYGTVEFYKNLFADIVGDIGDDGPDPSQNVVEGFIEALDEWQAYHQGAANRYQELLNKLR